MGRQGGLKVSQCNFISQERQWKGLTCRGRTVYKESVQQKKKKNEEEEENYLFFGVLC